jgi:hypothetical protein
MRERTRPLDSIDPGNATDPAGEKSQGQKLADIRQKGEGLLQAAQDSIRKALSGDSRTFLAQGRQQGGQ